MQDATIIVMAHELTSMVRKNSSVDWDKKGFARTAMRGDS